MFANDSEYVDSGIYYQCYHSYDMGYYYVCDYYRIGLLYDGWTTAMYFTAIDGYDWYDNTDGNYIVE